MPPLRPTLEQLEDRNVPASFGIPWPDATLLTLSFAPNGTEIGRYQNDLFERLDATIGREAWQTTMLRAFQTWAIETNLNIGVVTDSGDRFGALGLSENDPRFGDIRIGSFEQSQTSLAIAVPYAETAGTWSGDVFLNSAIDFTVEPTAGVAPKAPSALTASLAKSFLNRWAEVGANAATTALLENGEGPSETRDDAGNDFGSMLIAGGESADGRLFDLLTVMLHEAGHVFGIGGANDTTSAMSSYSVSKTGLNEGDVAAITSLYGARLEDAYDLAANNDRVGGATVLGSLGSTQLLSLDADVTRLNDIDWYQIKTGSQRITSNLTFEVDTKGISLLAPRITVYDSRMRVVASASAASPLADDLTVSVKSAKPNETYYVKIESGVQDVFGIGAYQLNVGYVSKKEAAKPTAPALEELPILHDDLHSDDSLASAAPLQTTIGYEANSHYETIGSISDATDVDFYRFTAQSLAPGQTGITTISATSFQSDGLQPILAVYDAHGNAVDIRPFDDGNGIYSLQLTDLDEGADYFLSVKGQDAQIGNYALTIDTRTVSLATLTTTTLDASSPHDFQILSLQQSQLFHFEVSAFTLDGSVDTAVVMTIYTQFGMMVDSVAIRPGETRSLDVMLTAGNYVVGLTAIDRNGRLSVPVSVTVKGASLSDPIGPEPVDTVTDPALIEPTYIEPAIPPEYWMNDPITSTEYTWLDPVEPPTDPWWEDPVYNDYSWMTDIAPPDPWIEPTWIDPVLTEPAPIVEPEPIVEPTPILEPEPTPWWEDPAVTGTDPVGEALPN